MSYWSTPDKPWLFNQYAEDYTQASRIPRRYVYGIAALKADIITAYAEHLGELREDYTIGVEYAKAAYLDGRMSPGDYNAKIKQLGRTRRMMIRRLELLQLLHTHHTSTLPLTNARAKIRIAG